MGSMIKEPFIYGYCIKKDELRLPIERYEEAGFDVVEDDDYWIIGAINDNKIANTYEYMNKVKPWQIFTSLKFKELSDDNLR